MKRILMILGVVALLAGAWFVYRANDHPGLGCCSQQIQPLVPFPRLADNFEKSMEFLNRRGQQENIDVKILPAWLKVDPFE